MTYFVIAEINIGKIIIVGKFDLLGMNKKHIVQIQTNSIVNNSFFIYILLEKIEKKILNKL